MSEACCAAFLGNRTDAFTIPAQSSGVVDVEVKLYDDVCKVKDTC